MLKYSATDISFIKKNFTDYQQVLSFSDKKLVLRKINNLIIQKGFDEKEDYNDFGRNAQKIYDNIYLNN